MITTIEQLGLGDLLGGAVGGGLAQGVQEVREQKLREKMGNLQFEREKQLQGLKAQDDLKKILYKQESQMNLLNSLFGGAPQQGSNMQELGSQGQMQGSPSQQFGPPEQGKRASAQQGQGGIDFASMPDEQIAKISIVNPMLARLIEQQKDRTIREQRAEKEFQLKEKLVSPEHKREQQIEASQASADVKYNQELQNASKQHELKEQSLDRLEKLNEKGVTGKPYEKLLEKAGLVSLTSEGRREFAADVKNLITDIRSILGGQFSNFEFQTILNAYPSVDFSKGANAAIIRNLKGFQDIKTKEVQFANQIKKENGGKLPYDFQSQVNERVKEYAHSKLPEFKENTREIMNEEYGIQPGFVLMFDPTGEPLQVHQNEVDKYLELGAINP